MKNKYYDLIDQTFDFPQDEFRTEDGELYFHDIPFIAQFIVISTNDILHAHLRQFYSTRFDNLQPSHLHWQQ